MTREVFIAHVEREQEALRGFLLALCCGNKIFAVGVTVARALETYVTTKKEIRAFDGWTNKFIFPPYQFSVPDAFVTNFHLPYSTMLMTAAAFGGYRPVMDAYKVAIEQGYQFGTYGDAMLII
ncbi:MAG: S-adenosylmethionine:tRNA ribosyltransferase-isomerase [Bacteroidales bacterium]|nr:S-adenosylmethionine:tRNA ribosyltransferase-isomerase [Bacteroidales bacterium]